MKHSQERLTCYKSANHLWKCDGEYENAGTYFALNIIHCSKIKEIFLY